VYLERITAKVSDSVSCFCLQLNAVHFVLLYTTAGPSYPPGQGYPSAVSPPGSSYPTARSYYFIRSRLNGLVLDVEGANPNPGAPVVTWNQKSGNCDNQLWYDDFATGTIRSKLNNYCLDWNGNFTHMCCL